MRTLLLIAAFLAACSERLPPLPISQTQNQSVCGDGKQEHGEACDDGNAINGDACLNDCRIAGCGDGTARSDLANGAEGFEACDDGDDDNFNACTNDCQLAGCGDGILRTDLRVLDPGYERCDDGNEQADDSCTNDCRLARCGDGILRGGLATDDPNYEACDDGNQVSGDGCSGTCRPEGCGNGVIDPGEGCDDGNNDPADGCTTACQVADCGDATVRRDLQPNDPGFEACDDGNVLPHDGCHNCALTACGDGNPRQDLAPGSMDPCLQPGAVCAVAGESCRAGLCYTIGYEACDDGDATDSNACTNACLRAACGDAILRTDLSDGAEHFEACDDGDGIDSNTCTNSCQTAVCGDGVRREDLQVGTRISCRHGEEEVCPAGESCLGDTCYTTGYEWCDDGNNSNLDRCSTACGRLGEDITHPGASCTELLELGVTESGLYWIDPDGFGEGVAAEHIYCDQVTDGGGWAILVGEGAAEPPPCSWFDVIRGTDLNPSDGALISCTSDAIFWSDSEPGPQPQARIRLTSTFDFRQTRFSGTLYATPAHSVANYWGLPDTQQREAQSEQVNQPMSCDDVLFDEAITFWEDGNTMSFVARGKYSTQNACDEPPRNTFIRLTGVAVR
jgi:cysteine-rich repeat protein